jgi:hypothetical protein
MYDPCKSWILKVRLVGRMACNIFTFMDDKRVTVPDEELTWQASPALASKQSYLWIQDAGRKARPSSTMPGAWAGAIVHVLPTLGMCILISEEKWEWMKGILNKWWKQVAVDAMPELSHKELLLDWGFLVYVTRTYLAMVPCLKGFHLTIKMWMGGRDAEGWKVQVSLSIGANLSVSSLDGTRARGHQLDLSLEDKDEEVARAAHHWGMKTGVGDAYAPGNGLTVPVPRFKDGLAALIRLTDFSIPPLGVVRPPQVVHMFYGFRDASGKHGLQNGSRHPTRFDTSSGFGQLRRRKRPQITKS